MGSRCCRDRENSRHKESPALANRRAGFPGTGSYCRGTFAARSSFPLQLQLESIVDIWHQKLSTGLKGGCASFLTGGGTRESRLALTAGGLLRTGGVTCGIGEGLRGAIAISGFFAAGAEARADGALGFATCATGPRAVLGSLDSEAAGGTGAGLVAAAASGSWVRVGAGAVRCAGRAKCSRPGFHIT